MDLDIWKLPEIPAPSRPKSAPHFVFIGRLIDWKRLDFVLHALVQLPNATLEVIGDGDMRLAWQQLSQQLGLSSRVNFSGWLSHLESAHHLQNATALLVPSLFECGGVVVLEAMAVGTPVIATHWGGPASYINESSGILVDVTSTESIVSGFVAAMQTLATEPETRSRFSRAGRALIEQHYDWKVKIDRILELYQQALDAQPGA